MVGSLLGNLKTKDQRFKSRHKQMGLLFNQIPVDLYNLKLTQILQAFGPLASTVTLQC